LRRLQHFSVNPEKYCDWELVRDGAVAEKGTIQPDADGLLTIPRLTISQTPAVLNLKPRP
jgi:hypothetical protein